MHYHKINYLSLKKFVVLTRLENVNFVGLCILRTPLPGLLFFPAYSFNLRIYHHSGHRSRA